MQYVANQWLTLWLRTLVIIQFSKFTYNSVNTSMTMGTCDWKTFGEE